MMTDEELSSQLNTIASEIQEQSPSKIPSQKLSDLEELLNLLYQKYSAGGNTKDLERAILDALGLAAYLNEVNSRNKLRPPDFFVSLKIMSQLLPVILFFVEEKPWFARLREQPVRLYL